MKCSRRNLDLFLDAKTFVKENNIYNMHKYCDILKFNIQDIVQNTIPPTSGNSHVSYETRKKVKNEPVRMLAF